MYIGTKKEILKNRSIHKIEFTESFHRKIPGPDVYMVTKRNSSNVYSIIIYNSLGNWKQREMSISKEWINILQHSHTMETIQQRK